MRLPSGLQSLARTIRRSVLAREVGSLWIAEVVVLGTAVIQAAVVARALGPRDFGAAALIMSSTTLIFTFLDPQSQEALVKYLGAHHANGRIREALAVARVAYGADLVLGVAGFSLVAAGAPWISDHVIRSPDVVHLLVLYAAASVLSAPSTTSKGILTTFRRFHAVAVLQSGTAVLRTALMIAFVAADPGINSVVHAAAISVVVESLCAALLADRTLRDKLAGSWWRSRRAVLGEQFREIVRFMVYTDVTSLVTVFVKEADLVILGYIRGPTEAGYYRVARLVTGPLASIAGPLQRAVYPRLAAMAGTDDRASLQHVARIYTIRIGLPIAGAALCGVPLLPFAIPALAGSEFRPAVDAAIVLLIGGALILPSFWVRPMLLTTGHVRFLLAVSIVAGTLTVMGYLVLGEWIGDVGVALSRAAIAGVAGSLVVVIYFFRACNRQGPVSPPTLPTQVLD